MSVDDELAQLLRERPAAKLLLLTNVPGNASRWQQLCQPLCETLITSDDPALAGIGHVDAALVVDLLDRLDKRTAIELLGRLRTLHTDLLYVLATDDPRWSLADWLALALQRVAEFDDGGRHLTLYRYDLGSYNRKRNWNNPQYWANPENWGKYRW